MADENAFRFRITRLHGSTGKAWLEQLPSLIDSIESSWHIEVGEPFSGLNYHFIAAVTYEDGSEAILKLGVPGEHLDREVECLVRYAGRAAVNLLRHDLGLGALLLERIRPGENLKQLDEMRAVEAAAGVMRQLHLADLPDKNMPTVEDWGKGFHRYREQFPGSEGVLPSELIDAAEGIFADLVGSMDTPVLLHGDLHHENILAAKREAWLAIDPQGVLGEPAYEAGAFLRNPVPEMLAWDGLERTLEARVSRFSDLLGVDRRRVAGWGFAQAVLSAIWSLEEGDRGWEGALYLAQVMQRSAFI